MRTGVIIYVSCWDQPIDPRIDLEDLEERADFPGADATCLACSEAEISWGLWRFVTRGYGRVHCVNAHFDAKRRAVVTQGQPLRLCG